VKFLLLEAYGLVPYPGDRHLVEFFPYFVSEKTHHGADFGVSLTSIHSRRVEWVGWYRQRMEEWTRDRPDSIPRQPSDEALAPILAALLSDGPPTVQPATMPNDGQVTALPTGTAVETMATFANGMVSPHASGSLPESIFALVQKHALNQDLMVEAALEGSRAKALQAMLADPLNNNNDFREIAAMLDELLRANASLLPQFSSPCAPARRIAGAPAADSGKIWSNARC
jgi:alpha-galactosidase